jgi:hypothetical protein
MPLSGARPVREIENAIVFFTQLGLELEGRAPNDPPSA